jgi:hypothetical protein
MGDKLLSMKNIFMAMRDKMDIIMYFTSNKTEKVTDKKIAGMGQIGAKHVIETLMTNKEKEPQQVERTEETNQETSSVRNGEETKA